MKKKGILFLIVLLAALLRLAYLSSDPPSLNWDEASVGYNAYSLLRTGSDEYGNRLPLAIRSFNDYKPPVYTYLVIPFVAFFGLTETAVRLPSALAGIAAVLISYFFFRELLGLSGVKNSRLPLLAALFLAVSPWHLQFSRIAFEASLALFFFVSAVTCLLLFFNHSKIYYLYLASILFVASVYTHHSVKLILPLFLLFVVLFYHRLFLKTWQPTLVAAILGLILLLPLVRSTLRTQGQATRFLTVSIFAAPNQFHNQGEPIPVVLLNNYLSHLDPQFLFFGIGDNPRHHAPNSGVLLLFDLPFLVPGLLMLIRKKPRYLPIILSWFLAAPLPAIISIDNPHASRSFLYLPVYQFLTALGLVFVAKKLAQPPVKVLIALVFILNLIYFFRQYFVRLPVEFAQAWQYGYKEMVAKVESLAPKYQMVIISTAYDQPYIYFLFYGHTDPAVKNDGTFSQKIGKYNFVNFQSGTWVNNLSQKSLSVVSPADKVSLARTIAEIDYPNGSPAFRLTENP